MNLSINTMYDNFKWVVENFNMNCCNYYSVNDLGKSVLQSNRDEIERLIKSIRDNH